MPWQLTMRVLSCMLIMSITPATTPGTDDPALEGATGAPYLGAHACWCCWYCGAYGCGSSGLECVAAVGDGCCTWAATPLAGGGAPAPLAQGARALIGSKTFACTLGAPYGAPTGAAGDHPCWCWSRPEAGAGLCVELV